MTPEKPTLAIARDGFFGRPLSSDDQNYVRELTTYSISRLQKEPVELVKESEKIDGEIEALAVRNYRSFIETSQALSQAHHAIAKMDSSLRELVTHVPKFIQSVEGFSKEAATVKDTQRLNRIISEHETDLVELLELPSLMETCVRNGLYEEALDVEAYAASLAARCPDVSILQDLVRDMEGTVRTLFAQLLDKLRSQIQLSSCLRVVSYLRRLKILSEPALRAEFLRSRTAWLTTVLEAVDDSGPEYLSKYIDNCRVHLREVIIQYRAIFVDDSSAAEEDEDKGLLCFWANSRILILVNTIRRGLSTITDGALISNIIEQAMYCGLSLVRVGSDFRSLLPAVFEERIFQIFGETLESAKEQFLFSLEEYDWHMSAEQLSRLGIPTTQGVLVEFPALATLANAFVNAVNMLRHCALMSLCSRAAEKSNQVLLWAANHLQSLQLNWQETTPRNELIALAQALSTHLLPFVSKLLKEVFNQKQDILNSVAILAPLQGLFEEAKASEQSLRQHSDSLLQPSEGVTLGRSPSSSDNVILHEEHKSPAQSEVAGTPAASPEAVSLHTVASLEPRAAQPEPATEVPQGSEQTGLEAS